MKQGESEHNESLWIVKKMSKPYDMIQRLEELIIHTCSSIGT
jgi:hypothetical protein